MAGIVLSTWQLILAIGAILFLLFTIALHISFLVKLVKGLLFAGALSLAVFFLVQTYLWHQEPEFMAAIYFVAVIAGKLMAAKLSNHP